MLNHPPIITPAAGRRARQNWDNPTQTVYSSECWNNYLRHCSISWVVWGWGSLSHSSIFPYSARPSPLTLRNRVIPPALQLLNHSCSVVQHQIAPTHNSYTYERGPQMAKNAHGAAAAVEPLLVILACIRRVKLSVVLFLLFRFFFCFSASR